VGAGGVECVLELPLSQREQQALHASAEILKEAIQKV
jgi:malate/lactate dehydrogenase